MKPTDLRWTVRDSYSSVPFPAHWLCDPCCMTSIWMLCLASIPGNGISNSFTKFTTTHTLRGSQMLTLPVASCIVPSHLEDFEIEDEWPGCALQCNSRPQRMTHMYHSGGLLVSDVYSIDDLSPGSFDLEIITAITCAIVFLKTPPPRI